MTRRVHLAVGQAPAALGTTAERLRWLDTVLPEVSATGADLLLLPELFATGYNIGADVATRAEPRDGPIAEAISGMAQAHGVAILYGYPERDGARLFNAAQCFGPDGVRLCNHRKLLIPPGFERDHFEPGQDDSLFTYRGARFATLICYDAEFPETVRHVASKGAQIVLVPTALGAQWGWVAQKMIPTRAYENGVFLAYANSAGTERGLDYLGQSVIATPEGGELARAGAMAEILHGTLDLERVTAAQARLPYLTDRPTTA